MRNDTKAALPALIILLLVAVEIMGLGIAAISKVAGAAKSIAQLPQRPDHFAQPIPFDASAVPEPSPVPVPHPYFYHPNLQPALPQAPILTDGPERDKALEQAIHELSGGNHRVADLAANFAVATLGRMMPDDAHRAQVLALLMPLIGRSDESTLGNTLAVWGDDATEKTLIGKLSSTGRTYGQLSIFAFLGERNTPTAAAAIAGQMSNHEDHGVAYGALRQMGPVAEPAVRGLLTASDPHIVAEAISMLRRIGTPDSIPALENLANGRDAALRVMAKSAIDAINAKSR